MKAEPGSTAYMLEDMANQPFETVFIVGTGVIEGGWDAFNAAVSKATDNEFAVHASLHPIASLTFILRALAYTEETQTDAYKERKELLKKIRLQIKATFQEFQDNGKIKLRINSESDYFEELTLGKSLIITTNYDTLLEDRYCSTGKCSILYLHGNIRVPTGVYLPTETACEPYRDPSDPASGYLALSHRIGIEAIEHAKRLVIWGNSLDIYDAELCVLLAEGHRARGAAGCEYFVVDPSTTPVTRLKALIGDVTVTHFPPSKTISNCDRHE